MVECLSSMDYHQTNKQNMGKGMKINLGRHRTMGSFRIGTAMVFLEGKKIETDGHRHQAAMA